MLPCHHLLPDVFRSIGSGHKGSDSFHSERSVTRYHVLDLVTGDSPRPKLHCQLYIYNLTFSEGVMSAIHAGRYSLPRNRYKSCGSHMPGIHVALIRSGSASSFLALFHPYSRPTLFPGREVRNST